MKVVKTVIFLMMVFISIQSCATTKIVKCGSEWINLHKDNADLIGIYVQQYPDSIPERKSYEGKHPVMLIYLFNGNRAHTVTYSPDGQVQTGVWWDVPEKHWIKNKVSKNLKPDIECLYWK